MCEKGIDLLAQNDKGWTALHLAAANRHVDCVDVLLEYMDPQVCDLNEASACCGVLTIQSYCCCVAAH